ncbi:MAG: 1-deoxy-D-xylulose-5-phosphate reductoisomerase [Opitutaceae bacterium]
MGSRKKVILLGATGSIGTNALRVIARHPDRLELAGVVAHSRFEPLAAIAREFSVPHVGLYEPADAPNLDQLPSGARFHRGVEAITEMVSSVEADIVLVASAGTAALRPTLAAIERGRTIALANKEILVMAGRFVTEAARRRRVRLIPVDSEHNAIFQCLDAGARNGLRRLVLTASGGAFRETPVGELRHVTPEQALAHPNWSMGPKITIDSATMANKGLEVIEAKWLFDVAPAQIDVVIHPQSVVHSMVEYVDGSILAQLSPPSMTFAIQHALLHPDRAEGITRTLDFAQALTLDFLPLEPGRYPCLELARESLRSGGTAPAIFNAANEVAVKAFLGGGIAFLEIPEIIRKSMNGVTSREPGSLEEVLEVERETRRFAARLAARSAAS